LIFYICGEYRKKKIQQKMNQDEDEWAKGELDEDEMLPEN